MKIEKAVLIEAFQEMVRVAFFGAVSAIVSFEISNLSGLPQNELTAIGILFLKFIDKYIHDSKVIKVNGLTDTKIVTG